MISEKYNWVKNIEVDNDWLNAEYYKQECVEIENILMRNKNLRIFKMNEISNIDRVTGFEVEKHLEIVDSGIPYLRVKNVEECCLNFKDMQYIPLYVHHIFKKSQFVEHNIALTITGRVGTATIIPNGMECNACQDVVKIVVKDETQVDPFYLSLYLNTCYNYKMLNRFNSGGSRPRTLINNVREVKIPIPSPEIQKYIGDKVRKAEELREESKRLKKEAEELLNAEMGLIIEQDLSENGFTKYSWVNENILEDRIDCGFYSNEIIQLFNVLQENSSKMTTLNELVEKIYRDPMCYGFNYIDNDCSVKFYRGEDLDYFMEYEKVVNISSESYDVYKKAQVQFGDILFSVRGAIGKIGIITDEIKGLGSPNIIIIRPNKNKVDEGYLFVYLSSGIGQRVLNRYKMKTIQETILADDIKRIPIFYPNRDFQKKIGDIAKKSIKSMKQSKNLIQQAKQDVEDLIEGTFDTSKL